MIGKVDRDCEEEGGVMKIEEIIENTLLYDFYGELLTDHQKRIYEDVVFQDLSLTEVAEQEGISRQGVHDMIRRCEKALRGYEEKLGLVHKFQETRELVAEIHRLAGECRRTGDTEILRQIEQISEQIEAL